MNDDERLIAQSVREWANDLAGRVEAHRPSGDLVTHRRRRGLSRSRTVVACAAAATVALGVTGIVWALNRGGPEDQGPVVAPIVTQPAAPPPSVDPSPVTAASTGSGDAEGIIVTVTIPGQALVGTRVRIDVEIRNDGTTPVYWQAGGCAEPAAVVVGPVGVESGETPLGSPRLSAEQNWDGSADTLAAAIDSAGGSHLHRAIPEEMTGVADYGCASNSEMQALSVGESLTASSTAELRVGPGELPRGGAFEVNASFVPYAAPNDYPQSPLGEITASVAFTVVDHPSRVAEADAISDAVVSDGRLADWYPTVLLPGRDDLDQRMRVAATWWRGAWELWVRPAWGTSDALRLRLDSGTMSVVDARIVRGGSAPDDEPDAVDLPGKPPDEIVAPAGGVEPAAATATPSQVRPGDTLSVSAREDVCGGMAIVYEVAGEELRERGVMLDGPDGVATWHTAPPTEVHVTIPPCQPAQQTAPVSFQVPDLGAGEYQVCLTRDASACAVFTVVP